MKIAQSRFSRLKNVEIWGDDFDEDVWFTNDKMLLDDLIRVLSLEVDTSITQDTLADIFEVPVKNIFNPTLFLTTDPKFHSANGESCITFGVKDRELGQIFVTLYFKDVEIRAY